MHKHTVKREGQSKGKKGDSGKFEQNIRTVPLKAGHLESTQTIEEAKNLTENEKYCTLIA